MHTSSQPNEGSSRGGFSLFELLTVVVVVAVIASVAFPKIAYLSGVAARAGERQNAQNIVTMFEAGKAGGPVDWVTTSRNACIADVVAGRAAPASSIFAGKVFRVPNITGSDLAAVYRYIGMDANKNLFFDKSGSQPAN